MKAITIPALAVLLLVPGLAQAEQVRLRTGDFLQGEIIGDRSDEEHISIRLYSTGGEFTLRWDQLTPEDEKRLRDSLGLTPWSESDVPLIDGIMVLLKTGDVAFGVSDNVAETGKPLRVRRVDGVREYPRDTIAEIRPSKVNALDVYTPVELAERYRTEMNPSTSAGWFEFGKACLQAEAYRQADEGFRKALEDGEFAGSEPGTLAKNLLARVEVFVKAEDALKKVRDVKSLRFQKRFDQALEEVRNLRSQYEGDAAILRILELDRLEKQIAGDRKTYYTGEVRRRFWNLLEELVSAKIREKDPDDRTKDLSVKVVIQWAANPKGLSQEIFSGICGQTGLEESEARELWTNRGRGQVRHLPYGGGSFIHPEVAALVQRVLTPGSAGRNQPGSSRIQARPQAGRQQQMKVKSPDDWWATAGAKERKNFVKAWFAEFGSGVFEILRIDSEACKACQGKGMDVNVDSNGNEIRTPCGICNVAGQDRIVICR